MRPIWALVQIGELILVLGLAALVFGHAPWLHPVARAGVLFGAILALGSLNVTMAAGSRTTGNDRSKRIRRFRFGILAADVLRRRRDEDGVELKASGTLTPPLEGSEISLVLSRKQSGKWVKVAEGAVGQGRRRFNTSFARPKSGSCKVVAKFAGTALYAPARTRRSSAADRQPASGRGVMERRRCAA